MTTVKSLGGPLAVSSVEGRATRGQEAGKYSDIEAANARRVSRLCPGIVFG